MLASRTLFFPARAVAVLATLLIAVAVDGPARAQVPEGLSRLFRVEWNVNEGSPTATRVQGYVYNDSRYSVTDVRLSIVSVDAGGRPVGETFGWVFGDIPARSRAYFVVPLTEPAATYRVTVISFDVVSESGG